MKQFAIIGVSAFGHRILEELKDIECEIIIIDKNREIIEQYKDRVAAAYKADVINEEILKRLIPESIDAVVVDLGDNTEVSILATNYLKKLGVKNIIVKAETDQHGEILEIVGATKVVFPNREAAKRITPMLVSSLLFNYMPISNGLVMAEVHCPVEFQGKSLIESRLRQEKGVNVIAIRTTEQGEYRFFSPEYLLTKEDILLIVGKEQDIVLFAGVGASEKKRGLSSFFKSFMN